MTADRAGGSIQTVSGRAPNKVTRAGRRLWQREALLTSVLGEIERGNYRTPITVQSKDEIGATLQGLDRMQTALRERTDAERAISAENARIRTALDTVSSGAMLADAEGQIVYLNDAVREIFRKQANAIREQMPSFDPEKILGSSFDQFHRNPAHQRGLLSGLTATHRVDVKFGGASLRIVANPVMDDGRRVGTVVQWFDRTDEVATEREVQNAVERALSGDLMVRVEEEGKDAFFKVLAAGSHSQVLRNSLT